MLCRVEKLMVILICSLLLLGALTVHAEGIVTIDDLGTIDAGPDVTVEVDGNDELILDLDLSGLAGQSIDVKDTDVSLEAGEGEKALGDSVEDALNEGIVGAGEEDQSNATGVAINATNFPAEDFRLYVQANFDKDGDRKLSQSEIDAVDEIEVNYMDCPTLKGVEYFTNLRYLSCWSCGLKTLDVSKNKNLGCLHCDDNQLTKLNLSRNPELYVLCCNNNKLSKLDFSHNPELRNLECQKNRLTELDLSKNPKLEVFFCSENKLQSLDVSKNKELNWLYCDNNDISQLRVNNNAKLERLYCENNSLKKLDLSKNPKLEELRANGNQIKTIDIENCPKLRSWVKKNCYCENGYIAWGKDEYHELVCIDYETELKAGSKVLHEAEIPVNSTVFPDTAFRGYVRYYLDKNSNGYLSGTERREVKKLDLNNGVSWDIIDYDDDDDYWDDDYWDDDDDIVMIESLKGVEHFPNLRQLSCKNNKLKYLNLSKNTKLTNLDCRNNKIKTLIVGGNEKLIRLYCSGNKLTTLDVSNNKNLTHLLCTDNQLTSLDIGKCTALIDLDCADNALTKLKLDTQTKLQELHCEGNKLSALDVSKCAKLTELGCQSNRLTKLALGKQAKLNNLSAQDNKLNSIDIGDCPKLIALLEKKAATEGKHISWAKGALTIDRTTKLTSGGKQLYPPKDAIEISSVNFPSLAFRTALEEFDSNGDGYLTKAERLSVKIIDISGNKIANLKGIEYFPNLEELNCSQNKLETLDVSQNKKLKKLYCNDNRLASLSVKNNTKLTELNCSGNKLELLNATDCVEIVSLYCNKNELTKLALGKKEKLGNLNAEDNRITAIDIGDCPKLKTIVSKGTKIIKNGHVRWNDGALCIDVNTRLKAGNTVLYAPEKE